MTKIENRLLGGWSKLAFATEKSWRICDQKKIVNLSLWILQTWIVYIIIYNLSLWYVGYDMDMSDMVYHLNWILQNINICLLIL